jgi:hypothetical protein
MRGLAGGRGVEPFVPGLERAVERVANGDQLRDALVDLGELALREIANLAAGRPSLRALFEDPRELVERSARRTVCTCTTCAAV